MSVMPSEPLQDGSGKTAGAEQPLSVHSRLDPYLVWAQRTEFRYLVHGERGSLRLAGRLRENQSLAQAQASVRAVGAALDARMILETPFFTATMSPVSDEACSALLRHASYVLAEPGMRALDLPEPSAALTTLAGSGASSPIAQPTVPLEHPIVIGVVDGRCGFANDGFCSGSESRLDRYWDQGGAPPTRPADEGAWWSAPSGHRYGRVLDRSALDAIARRLSEAASTSQRAEIEKTIYRRLGHTPPQDADWSHGTHVLDTVLGELTDRFRPGVIYVQLPDAALRDTSARWTAAHVLDAIDYIVGHVKDGARAVINLSLGAFAGPHDGSSLLEQAIDSIAEQSNGRITFVVAAGNTGRVADDGTGDAKRCHASFKLPASAERVLAWDIDRADSTEVLSCGRRGLLARLASALRSLTRRTRRWPVEKRGRTPCASCRATVRSWPW